MTRPTAALFHFIGLIISGVGFKKCNDFPFYIIATSFVIQLLGFIVYSNPNSSIKLRQWADKSLQLYLKTLYLSLTTCELLRASKYDDTILLAFMSVSLVIAVTYVTLNVSDIFYDIIIVVQCSAACLIILESNAGYDKYWLLHFLFLFLLNNFSLPVLSQKFAIPQIDFSCLSLIFLNLFLINSFS